MLSNISVSLIYPVSSVITGYQNYAIRLLEGLRSLDNIEVEDLPIQKKEISFRGKPLLGTLSQVSASRMINPHGDIVHSLTPTVINKRTNIVTLHDIVPLAMKREYASSYYRKKGYDTIFNAVKKVPFAIVFTEVGRKDLLEALSVKEESIIVVPQSVDHETFYPDPDESLKKDQRKLIIAVGDINPRKRYDLLFKAAGGMEDARVVHIGPVNAWEEKRKELRSIISHYNNIEMIGPVDNDTLRKYMSSADLLVHLSEGEGFGSTTVEAMACGTNVLVSELPVFRETLQDMAFFTTLEVDQIRNDIHRALENGKPASDLVEYTKKYSIRSMAENTVEAYRHVLEYQKAMH